MWSTKRWTYNGVQPWIGLAHVGPLGNAFSEKNNLTLDRRAYTVFIALARDRDDALAALRNECLLQDLELIEVEDIEPAEERKTREGQLDKEITETIEWMYKENIWGCLYQLNTYPIDQSD